MKITIDQIKNNEAIRSYITKADQSLLALGFTEHSFPHVCRVAEYAKRILLTLGYPERDAELAEIAGYLHDIGNVINRDDHAQSGAIMAFRILDNMGAEPDEISAIITAIGNHDEHTAHPVTPIAAALILGDKTDVRRNRVRNSDISSFDIHDRVNYSVTRCDFSVDKCYAVLDIDIDTDICPVIDYFEIFIDRMNLCERAAKKLGIVFKLIINGQKML